MGRRHVRTILAWIGPALGVVGFVQAAPQSSNPVAPAAATYRAVLNRYCVTCHNEKLKTADLLLDRADVENVGGTAPVWEKVVRKLRTGSMPPAGIPRPDPATYKSFATYLETALDRAAAVKPNPGRPSVHRLNRAEYANAVRDLLAVEIDSSSFLPVDDTTYGFDNIADALSVSPMLLERYLSAARKVSHLAIGDTDVAPGAETHVVSPLAPQEDRMSEDLPFGSRGGTAVRHRFPLDGEYVIKIGLLKNNRDYTWGLYEGLTEPRQLDVRIDGARVKLFTVGGERKGMSKRLTNPGNQADDREVEQYEVYADAGLKVRVPVKAGMRLVQVAFVDDASEPEGALHPVPIADRLAFSSLYKEGTPAVASVMIDGPYNAKGVGDTPSRRKVFLCYPKGKEEEDPCAKKIFSTLARQAYRRPVTDADIQPLLGMYREGRRDGNFEAGVELALERILAAPDFLMRVEADPANLAPNTVYPIGDIELASRLSFFLWSSIPDGALLDLAARGKLKDPQVLEQQVQRMLADPRSKALVTNFAGQWLLLRNVRTVQPDTVGFPDFDDNLRDALYQETALFFENNLREDHSVLDLLNANYTFLNERLAQHYGIPGIHGSQFRRVTVTDENRKGLLGQGSLLTVTSYANRTSVVLRGKWLLENVFGTPPPPPPPNVPSLNASNAQGKILSVRQAMEKHRANPACAGCHARMDPLGFALENFDAIGQWRTVEGPEKTPIDTSGALADGTKFQGPAELRKILLRDPDAFVTTVTEKLLTYALGRGLEYYDAPAVRKIVRESAPNGYRWSAIINGIIKSTPFQMRRSRESS